MARHFETPHLACNLYGSRGLYVATGTGYVDWPVKYPDGRIAYDAPERVPSYLKRLVNLALDGS